MWISSDTYERILERLRDLETFARQVNDARSTVRDLRLELVTLRTQFNVLTDSLGLVHEQTPAKERYVKKGGPERA
jgi:hypothetical protein